MTAPLSLLPALRAEVGSTPDDPTCLTLLARWGTVPDAALAIIRPRLADAIQGAGSVTIPGLISASTPGAAVAALSAHVTRLERWSSQLSGLPYPGSGVAVGRVRRPGVARPGRQDRGTVPWAW